MLCDVHIVFVIRVTRGVLDVQLRDGVQMSNETKRTMENASCEFPNVI